MTATDRAGVVHQLNGGTTRCGQDATGWSRSITQLQLAGLVLLCPECELAS